MEGNKDYRYSDISEREKKPGFGATLFPKTEIMVPSIVCILKTVRHLTVPLWRSQVLNEMDALEIRNAAGGLWTAQDPCGSRIEQSTRKVFRG